MATIRNKTYLAKGKRGIAYTATLDGKKVLLKERNPDSDVDTIQHEAEILKAVNKKKIGPLFISCDDVTLVREYVDGPEILDWVADASVARIKKVLVAIIKQCRDLDLLGINKLEMTHPHKHILMRGDTPVFIDFDRSRHTTKPKNITQVVQWITNKELAGILAEKGINIPRESMLAHAKRYKQTYSAAVYDNIIQTVQNA